MVKELVKCDYCGKEFLRINTGNKFKSKFCSRECNGKAQYKLNNIIEYEDYAEIIIKDVHVLIDKEETEKVKVVKWSLCFDKSINNYYIQGHERSNWRSRKNIKLHRLIMNCPEGMVVDHINRNTLDNRKDNLKICTHRDNSKNKGNYKNNKTGYKHIFKDAKTDRYICEVKINGKQKYIKSSKDLGVVIEARNNCYKQIAATEVIEQNTLF